MKRILCILLIISSSAFAQTSGPTIHSIMRSQVAPNADALFALQGKQSVTDEEWVVVLQKVSYLHAAAHKLKTLNTVTEWQYHVDAIDALSERAVEQSLEKNIRGLANTGNKMFEVCYSCHTKFFPKGKNL
jgi:hypothetical protein